MSLADIEIDDSEMLIVVHILFLLLNMIFSLKSVANIKLYKVKISFMYSSMNKYIFKPNRAH